MWRSHDVDCLGVGYRAPPCLALPAVATAPGKADPAKADPARRIQEAACGAESGVNQGPDTVEAGDERSIAEGRLSRSDASPAVQEDIAMELLKEHRHDAQVHTHEHTHVTHYLSQALEWKHMTSTHDHEHNHAPLVHTHPPHKDVDAEHTREAHIHDHEHPAKSSA
jgi:hypothetical protein